MNKEQAKLAIWPLDACTDRQQYIIWRYAPDRQEHLSHEICCRYMPQSCSCSQKSSLKVVIGFLPVREQLDQQRTLWTTTLWLLCFLLLLWECGACRENYLKTCQTYLESFKIKKKNSESVESWSSAIPSPYFYPATWSRTAAQRAPSPPTFWHIKQNTYSVFVTFFYLIQHRVRK